MEKNGLFLQPMKICYPATIKFLIFSMIPRLFGGDVVVIVVFFVISAPRFVVCCFISDVDVNIVVVVGSYNYAIYL